MSFRQIIAVVLGALLQVSLLGIGTASLAPAENGCAPEACCCSGESSCPCVKSRDGNEKPSPPAIPASQEQLTPVIVPTDLEITGFLKSTDTVRKSGAFSRSDDFNGHRGVSLCVSFCRFTI